MNLEESIRSRPSEFEMLCVKRSVKSLYAFGSALTSKFNEETSDIDLLIELDIDDPIDRGENLMEIWDDFEMFFERKVDLLTPSSIINPRLKKRIDATKFLIYDGRKRAVFI